MIKVIVAKEAVFCQLFGDQRCLQQNSETTQR